MADDWTGQIAVVDSRAPLDAIVHIGAGAGADAGAIVATRARKIVLIEPNAELAVGLRRRFEDDERVTVVPAAVSAQEGESPLHVLNVAALSSLRAPRALNELFPGACELMTVAVRTRAIASLLDETCLSPDAANLLIIDAPGEEGVIVDGLVAAEPAGRVRHVLLRCGQEAFFEGGTTAQELVGRLEAAGYRLEWRSTDDPDFPQFRLAYDATIVQNTRLREALMAAECEVERLRAFESEAELARSRVAELESEVEAAQTARADVALALRLQTMREADLRDLQDRYAKLLEAKERQDALLYTLTQRLGAAAKYMERIESDPRMQSLDGPPSEGSAGWPSRRRAPTARKKKGS